MSSMLSISIIQHNFFIDIHIEIAHEISINSQASSYYVLYAWTPATTEKMMEILVFTGASTPFSPFCRRTIEDTSKSHLYSQSRYHYKAKSDHVTSSDTNFAGSVHRVSQSVDYTRQVYFNIANIDIFRISIKIILNIESTKL